MKTLKLIKHASQHYHKIIVERSELVIGHAVMEADGFYYFNPERRDGIWNQHTIQQIADILKELNKDYEQSLECEL